MSDSLIEAILVTAIFVGLVALAVAMAVAGGMWLRP